MKLNCPVVQIYEFFPLKKLTNIWILLKVPMKPPDSQWNFLRIFLFLKISITRFYPPGSKSVALQLGVHLILLYIIRISSWWWRHFFYLDGGRLTVGGGWGPTFLVFNFLYNTMVNTLDIAVYMYIDIYIYISVHNKFRVGLIFSTSWGWGHKNSKTIPRLDFF